MLSLLLGLMNYKCKIEMFEEDGLIYLEDAASISKVSARLAAQGLLQEESKAFAVGKKHVFGFEKAAALIIEP